MTKTLNQQKFTQIESVFEQKFTQIESVFEGRFKEVMENLKSDELINEIKSDFWLLSGQDVIVKLPSIDVYDAEDLTDKQAEDVYWGILGEIANILGNNLDKIDGFDMQFNIELSEHCIACAADGEVMLLFRMKLELV